LSTYKLTPRELAMKIILDVIENTGITATAGIGTNLYLCKVAMDILAKHIPADENGVRIAELDEMTYRQTMWSHQPLTDFWRVGRGYAKKLEAHGMFTMGDVARMSVNNEDFLYKMFGKNAELLRSEERRVGTECRSRWVNDGQTRKSTRRDAQRASTIV